MESLKPVRLAYKKFEPDTGADESLAPIIYLHGLSAVKEYWFDIPQKVADATKRKSFSVDARNHGDSERSDHFNFDLNVEDFCQFMDTMGIQKAILVGHSMGGVTAIKTALKRPERVESIVVEDMLVRKLSKFFVDMITRYLKILREALANVPAGLKDEEIGEFVFQRLIDNTPEELVQQMKKRVQEGKNNSFMDVFFKRDEEGRFILKCNIDVITKAMAAYDTIASEPEGVFDGSAFFIYGTESPFKVPDDEEHIRKFFPNVVLEAINADHSIHLNEPGKFTDAVIKFLS